MYSVRLIDYATPSFVSGTKDYYGSKESILEVLKNDRLHCPEMLEAAEEFFSGQGAGKISVCYEEPEPLVKPVKIIGEAALGQTPFKWSHFNIWECEHEILADSMSGRVVYIEDEDGRINRCLQPVFVNLRNVLDDQRERFFANGGAYFGCPGIIVHDVTEPLKMLTTNRLTACEKRFECMEDALLDMQSPKDINFSVFLDDIFGDG